MRTAANGPTTAELNAALEPYGIDLNDLPTVVRDAIVAREAFTLVEGVAPTGMYKQRIPADDLVWKLLRHDQTAMVIEQVEIYAIHNGKSMNGGKHLQLPEIPPYPTLEKPEVHVIPEELPTQRSAHFHHRGRKEGRRTPHAVHVQGQYALGVQASSSSVAHELPRWQTTNRLEDHR